jgi:hypothetical protein
MCTYQEFCRLRDLHIPGVNAPKHTEADAFFMAAAQLAVPDGYKLVPLEPTPEIIAGAAVAIWPTAASQVAADDLANIEMLQFLTDVVTATGLLAHGKTDKRLATRISSHAYKVRAYLTAATVQTQEPVLWYDASAAPHEDHGVLFDGARQIAILGTTKGPFGTYITPLYTNRAPAQPLAALPNEENALRYPATMTVALAEVLGLMNFRTGPIAHAYRAAGAEIRTKCEDEQAFVLDRYLRLALEHGDEWRTAAEADLKAAYARAEASKAVKS